MKFSTKRSSVAIPPGAALFHIGSPKTATSAIQRAAVERRDELREAGVVYPTCRPGATSAHRHRDPVRSLRAYGLDSTVDPEEWNEIVAQREHDPQARLLVSDEWASTLPRRSIERALDTLGEDAHVAYTIRNFGEFLLSLWQEDVRSGKVRVGFGPWLQERDLSEGTPSGRGRIPIERQADRLVRWVEVFGRENVHVILTDRSAPERVFDAFGALLDVPASKLTPPEHAERAPGANRGLSAVEVAYVLQAGDAAREAGLSEDAIKRSLHRGAFKRLQEQRTPPPAEPAPGVPASMRRRLADFAAAQWEVFEQLGVRIVGDRDEFVRDARAEVPVDTTTVPLDIATEVLIGAIEKRS